MEKEIIDELNIEDLEDLGAFFEDVRAQFFESLELETILQNHPVFVRMDLQSDHIDSLIEYKTRSRYVANPNPNKVKRVKERVGADLERLKREIWDCIEKNLKE